MIEISISAPSLAKLKEAVPDQKMIDKILAAAVKRTTKSALSRLQREIAKVVTLKRAKVNENVVAEKTATKFSGGVRIKSKAIPLSYYRYRASKRRGVTATTRKSGGQLQLPFAFKATMPTGLTSPFARVRGKKTVPTKGRYAGRTVTRGPNKGQPLRRAPIRRLFGPNLVGITDMGKAQISVGDEFQKNVVNQASRFLKIPVADVRGLLT